jgi:hypothetical protein
LTVGGAPGSGGDGFGERRRETIPGWAGSVGRKENKMGFPRVWADLKTGCKKMLSNLFKAFRFKNSKI